MTQRALIAGITGITDLVALLAKRAGCHGQGRGGTIAWWQAQAR